MNDALKHLMSVADGYCMKVDPEEVAEAALEYARACGWMPPEQVRDHADATGEDTKRIADLEHAIVEICCAFENEGPSTSLNLCDAVNYARTLIEVKP